MLVEIDDGVVINSSHVRKIDASQDGRVELTWSDGSTEVVLDSARRLERAQGWMFSVPPGQLHNSEMVVAVHVTHRGAEPVTIATPRARPKRA